MSIAIEFNINDQATPEIKRKLAASDPHVVATRVVVPLARHWRKSLAKMPKNKMGWPSTGFWEDAARMVEGIADGPNVRLYSDKLGLRQRLYGGPIKAVNVKNLTIPICREAYGTNVSDWGHENLVLVILADGRKFYALWLGGKSALKTYRKSGVGKGKFTTSKGTTKRAQKYRALAGGSVEKPKVIIFRGSGRGTGGRAERHMGLKFLFRLIPQTQSQAPNPDVIPADLMDLAMEETIKAIE